MNRWRRRMIIFVGKLPGIRDINEQHGTAECPLRRPRQYTNSLTALVLCIGLASVAKQGEADVTDSPSSHVYRGREMTAEDLWAFSSIDEKREFAITDLTTGETGRFILQDKTIDISWYFSAKAAVTVLERGGHASICLIEKITKCISVSFDPRSDRCTYLIRETRDDRRACLREKAKPQNE